MSHSTIAWKQPFVSKPFSCWLLKFSCGSAQSFKSRCFVRKSTITDHTFLGVEHSSMNVDAVASGQGTGSTFFQTSLQTIFSQCGIRSVTVHDWVVDIGPSPRPCVGPTATSLHRITGAV
eukprot:scaffold113_cov339-Pavlova_lutheri.AAC.47